MIRKILLISGMLCFLLNSYAQTPWPAITKTTKPWTRWWWMSSAVDEKNLDHLLTAYSEAGFGGVEVTPIYGATGFEKRYINFLSPEWMHMLNFTVAKANAAGMGVDMNTGTGWPFGGPQVTYQDAASKLIIQKYSLKEKKSFDEKIIVNDEKQLQAGAELQAAIAYGNNGETISVLDKIDHSGKLNWVPPSGNWELYAVFSGRTLQMVKRSAAGGEGLVMNHLNKKAVDNYLKRFDTAFSGKAPGIRAFFNDSYEVYNANWSPDLLAEFKKRKGYDLSLHIKQLLSDDSTDNAIRIKNDYRETMSQMILDNMAVNWTNWAHKYNRITKYQAHGSPGNLLDLYAAADIPECEAYFGLTYFPIPGLRHDTTDVVNPNSNPNIFKFASSAAHVFGKKLTSSETLVWLTDHFKTSLSQCKPEVERLFLGGENHVFYHGTTYSPDDVPFPGWQFYASSNLTPSNSLWSQLSGLNNYVARCQSVLQSGQSDNELLIYWPVYDCWANPKGTDLQLSVHNDTTWLTPTEFNKTATQLQNAGYSTDYVSDKMLMQSQVKNKSIQIVVAASSHKALIIPPCNFMPAETFDKIIQLANAGANVIFQNFPNDVPGYNNAEERRKKLKQLITSVKLLDKGNNIMEAATGKGKIILSPDIQKGLEYLNIQRETLVDAGLQFIRRSVDGGKYYYIVNHSANAVNTMLPVQFPSNSVLMMDPQTGTTGIAHSIKKKNTTDVQFQLKSGQAIILKTSVNKETGVLWKYFEPTGMSITLDGKWALHFKEGGPDLPADKKMATLQPWTDFTDDSTTQSFSGTGVYSTEFNLSSKNAAGYLLQLGKVYQSAKVFINEKEIGILWSIPFEAEVGKYLKQGKNTIRIEVANLMANRVRNMDRNKQVWRKFHEINFVNINYKPFDASNWKVETSGLQGPVTITALKSN
ncbi:MAG: glycosyl hydrolase [Ferruginibacter sp.]